MSLQTAFEGNIIGTVLAKLSASEPRTTLLGALLGAVIAAKVDYPKVLAGDPTEIANLIASLLVVIFGYFTNHRNVLPPARPKG